LSEESRSVPLSFGIPRHSMKSELVRRRGRS
jgi:hypothetical protein